MVAVRPMSAADLAALPDDERGELLDGVMLPMTPVKKVHWRLAAKVMRVLGNYAEEHGLGIVGQERGYLLHTNPDTVLAPDVSFVSTDRDVDDEDLAGFAPLAPDLAVEVRSPANSGAELARKVEIYLAAGCPLVWVVDHSARTVAVHAPDRPAAVLGPGDLLGGESVLAGFTVEVGALFA